MAFSGLVKQYSADVFAAVTLTWLAVDLLDRSQLTRRWLWAAFTGAALLWISQSVAPVRGDAATFKLMGTNVLNPRYGRINGPQPAEAIG